MTAKLTESVRQILADLHSRRVKTMDPDTLKINIDQRQTLVDTANYDGFIRAGDTVEPFVLQNVVGGELTLVSLLSDGPAVLVFFRFEGCPACNLALPYYQRALWPELRKLGATLTAVSPQIPERLGAIKDRHALEFNVASDIDNVLARRLGILYTFDDASRRSAKAKGSWIGEITGTGTWELPMPTVVVIGRDRVVAFADVAPDWLVRTEAEPVIETVRSLSLVDAR